MIDNIKIMLGASAPNFTDEHITLVLHQARMEVKNYCKRDLDDELESIAEEIALIKLNRQNTEGLASASFSGVSETYIDGYPAHIVSALNSKRKIKFI